MLSFDLTYKITTSAFYESVDSSLLAIGLNNGATIVYDLQVMSENYILECHGGAVTAIAFTNNLLINGSDYGTIYIFKLSLNKSELVYKCSNV